MVPWKSKGCKYECFCCISDQIYDVLNGSVLPVGFKTQILIHFVIQNYSASPNGSQLSILTLVASSCDSKVPDSSTMQDLSTHRMMKPAAGAREHTTHPSKIISLTPHASLHLNRAAFSGLAQLSSHYHEQNLLPELKRSVFLKWFAEPSSVFFLNILYMIIELTNFVVDTEYKL